MEGKGLTGMSVVVLKSTAVTVLVLDKLSQSAAEALLKS